MCDLSFNEETNYVARNDIFSLQWISYVPTWVSLDNWGTLIFCLLSYYIISKDKFYKVEIMDIGKIFLTHWCQWNMQMQPPHKLMWCLLYGMRYLGRIPIIVYLRTWGHTFNNVQFLLVIDLIEIISSRQLIGRVYPL